MKVIHYFQPDSGLSTAFHSFDVCLGGDSEKKIPPQRDPVCRIYAASWQGLLADRGYNIGRN